jgi:hypothetical protein
MRANPITQEQACALHLLDLCRAYPRDPAAQRATAILDAYRLRGIEVRKQAALKAAQASERSASPAKLAAARRGAQNEAAPLAAQSPS